MCGPEVIVNLRYTVFFHNGLNRIDPNCRELLARRAAFYALFSFLSAGLVHAFLRATAVILGQMT